MSPSWPRDWIRRPNWTPRSPLRRSRSASAVTVVLPDGSTRGSPWRTVDDPEFARAVAGEAFTAQDARGGRVYVPVVDTAGTTVVRAALRTDQLSAGVLEAWAWIAGLGLLLVGAAIGVALWAARRISRPLLTVADTAHRLRAGELSAPAPEVGPGETVEVARALHGLADRIATLLADERAAVGDRAHRLRTPATALRLDTEGVADPEVRGRLVAHVTTLASAIDHLVKEAGRPVPDDLPTGCDATAVVGERVHSWEALADDQRRPLRLDLPGRVLQVPMAASDLADVVDIAIDNVFAHTDEGVGFGVTLRDVAGGIELRVEDDGPRYPVGGAATRAGSTGVGWENARRLVGQAGGSLRRSEPGRTGARLVVTLPSA